MLALVDATRHSDQSIEILRQSIARWGAFGPVAYVLLVIVEVMVAPIPGTLLYAPGGAIFGGALGGTLSLAGNVIGATLACAVAKLFEARVAHLIEASHLERYRSAIIQRAVWLVFLLRVNPLTSSDLVSYAAGLVGVPVWQVALGTLIGMTPQCYAQSYLAERLLPLLPGSAILLVLCGVAYAAIVIWLIVRSR